MDGQFENENQVPESSYADPNEGAVYREPEKKPEETQRMPYAYGESYHSFQSAGMDTSPMPMGEWLLVLLVGAVPCLGLIFYLIWAFEKNGNINRRNYCRASLVMQLIGIVVAIIFVSFSMVAAFTF